VLRSLQTRILLALALATTFVLGAVLPGAIGKTVVEPTAIRNALAQTSKVQGAPQRTLVLSRVEVEPGAQLALHHHLGTQVAHIEAGTLTYTVRRGSAVVKTGESDQNPKLVRTIKAGQTAPIRTGQWIVEQPSDIHEAANRGGSPVVIYLATLLETGADPSTSVTLP